MIYIIEEFTMFPSTKAKAFQLFETFLAYNQYLSEKQSKKLEY